MRLLIVSQYFWPENFRVNDLAMAFIERGHDVTILTGQPNYPDGVVFPDYRENPAAFSAFEGAIVHRVPIFPRGSGSIRLVLNYLSFVLAASTIGIWKLRGKPFDAIFVFQTSPITSALPAVLLRRLKRASLTMWVLDLWPDTLSAIGIVRSQRLLELVGRLVGFVYKRCDLILVQSRGFIDNVRGYTRRVERIEYFPNWAEPEFASQVAVIAAPELTPYASHFKLIFAGNIGEAQDFPALIEAAHLLRDEERLRWIIVGDGRAAPMVRAQIVQHGLQDRVILLGRYPIERMPGFFAGADAMLVSLRNEPIWSMTIPGKVQSYLAAGKPVIGMLNGEGAAVIANAGAGFATPAGDSEALAASVRQMMALTDTARAEMGRRGRDYCQREFDRNTLMARLEQRISTLRPESADR
jgi:colanic acid biosynthesis glycosyl transferase WcaI